MAITMTPAAAERVKSFLVSRGKGIGLRLGLRTSGCSGMAYVLEFVDDLNADDEVFDIEDVKIIIDAKSFVYLQGIELD
ncbi:iron-sulfur cluster assembly accessory protein, partial [Shewanella colwelliana]